MTAYVTATYADRAEIITDAACLDTGTGLMMMLMGKTLMWRREFPLLVTGRGDFPALIDLGTRMKPLVDRFRTVDASIAAITDFLQRERHRAASMPAGQDLVLAGWSEANGASHWRAVLSPNDGEEPFELRRLDEQFCVGGVFDGSEFQRSGFSFEAFRYGLEDAGPDLIDAMRRKPVIDPAHPDLGPVCGIGGQLLLTAIHPEGIECRALGYWPDKLGERIDPAAKFTRFT